MKSCALHRESSGDTYGFVDDSVRILGKRESQDPEFPKEYLKLVGEEPTSVMADEMEKLVRELLRATEIVALSERVSEKCVIARPDFVDSICCLLLLILDP